MLAADSAQSTPLITAPPALTIAATAGLSLYYAIKTLSEEAAQRKHGPITISMVVPTILYTIYIYMYRPGGSFKMHY